jgi:hypothetical protein
VRERERVGKRGRERKARVLKRMGDLENTLQKILRLLYYRSIKFIKELTGIFSRKNLRNFFRNAPEYFSEKTQTIFIPQIYFKM